MRNLLYNSLLVLSVFLIISCSYSNQANSETAAVDTTALSSPDTTLTVTVDTTLVVTGEPVHSLAARGDSVAAQSTRVESTEPGTTSKHPGAIKNPGPDQAQTDSIKKAKTKGKKKN
ncbi:MAG: hypothetical protein ISS17_05025 [Bacteroidales bacterium]|nr:hypothetical protein [Bacteroidales bacterium]